jgi:hypothetical protein
MFIIRVYRVVVKSMVSSESMRLTSIIRGSICLLLLKLFSHQIVKLLIWIRYSLLQHFEK